MKFAKILGLAAMALAALMALAGTASATTLTSPAGATYTNAIKAENEGTVTLTSVFGGFGAVSCKKSKVEGVVETHGTGVTAGGQISNLTFTECTGGTPRSPVGEAEKSGKRGSLQVHRNADGTGNLTSLGAEVIIDGTAFGTCPFTTSSTGTSLGTLTTTVQTGGNATLDIKASIASPCGTGTWEGSYKVVSPTTLYIDA